MTVPGEEAPANSVPAAAVRRRVLALFGITGRKGRVGGQASRLVKARGSTPEVRPGLLGWRPEEEGGIPSVEVKFVDIGWNTVAKAALWSGSDAEARKRGEQTGLDTLVVHALNDAG